MANENTGIDAADVTFGIEIECHLPAGTGIRVGNYSGDGIQVPGLPAGWVAKSDCSIAHPYGRTPVEIVSPVLKGEEGLRQVAEACRKISALGAKVNPSCGFHVHVGVPGKISFRSVEFDGAYVARLIKLTARHESGLFAASGTKHRESSNWCKSIKRNHEGHEYESRQRSPYLGFKDKDTVSLDEIPSNHSQRYFSLNLVSTVGERRRPTAEYRCFSPTTSAVKAVSYVRLCVGLAVLASVPARKKIDWDGTLTPGDQRLHAKHGEGMKALIFLFYQLGWWKAYRNTPLGVIEGEGIPTLKETLAELRRLGSKYDENAPDDESDRAA
jgi:hypothetical protein